MKTSQLSILEINKTLDSYINSEVSKNNLLKIKEKIMQNKPQIDGFLKARKSNL